LNKSQKLLLLASASSILLWAVPYLRIAILPLIYLNTHFHELAHALAALASGGTPSHILVFANGGGETPVIGGNIILTASAGYPGTAILGAILILAGRTPEKAKTALKILSVSLALSTVLFVRGDIVGIISALFWIPVLWLLAVKLKGDNVQFATQFLGVQMSLTAFQAVLTVFQIAAESNSHSDAYILQQYTFIPDVVWAFGWVVFALVLAGITLKKSWYPTSKR